MKKTAANLASHSRIDLPDINVWLALVDERHVHHAAAKGYRNEESASRIAFCRVTMLGFLRLSSSGRVLAKPLSPREAWDIYGQFLSLPVIHFLPEPSHIDSRFCALTADERPPYRLWTDAYLAAFALTEGCRVVSFDADFQRFAGLDWLHLKL
jgi:toxin-antitoxin system PIN domain toxin